MVEIVPEVEFQYGGHGHLGEFKGMSFQSHLPHCRLLPLGEFTVVIPEPHTTLQLLSTVIEMKPDIVGVTETWATDSILDSELDLEGY